MNKQIQCSVAEEAAVAETVVMVMMVVVLGL